MTRRQRGPGRRAWVRSIEAVVFDCFGTIAEFVDEHFIKAFEQICQENALAISGKSLWDSWLAHGRTIAQERGRDPNHPLAGPEPAFFPYRETYVRQFERAFCSIDCSADAAAARTRIVQLLAAAPCFPEAAGVLNSLRPRYRLAVLSNADDDFLRACLLRNELSFEAVISSESVRSYKPRPGIFLRACETLGLPPSRVLYVGDSPVADVLGARAAGLAMAWVNRAGAPLPDHIPPPDIEISDLLGLLPLLTRPSVRAVAERS